MPPIRVLLVDDHRIVLDGLTAVLGSFDDIAVVGTAGDGDTAIGLFDSLQPDVTIVDLRMRPIDGIGVTELIRSHNPVARIILLTTYETDQEVFRAFRAGVAAYLLKDIDSFRLVSTIRLVHLGRRVIPPAIAAKLAENIAAENLTPRQMEVLGHLAEGRSNLEIANIITTTEGTVKAHVREILRKLHARDRTQAITIALRRGLVPSFDMR